MTSKQTSLCFLWDSIRHTCGWQPCADSPLGIQLLTMFLFTTQMSILWWFLKAFWMRSIPIKRKPKAPTDLLLPLVVARQVINVDIHQPVSIVTSNRNKQDYYHIASYKWLRHYLVQMTNSWFINSMSWPSPFGSIVEFVSNGFAEKAFNFQLQGILSILLTMIINLDITSY